MAQDKFGGSLVTTDRFGGTASDDKSTTRSVTDYARDVAATAVKGAIAVPEAVVGIADIASGGRVGKALENEGGTVGFRPKQAKEAVNDWHSDATKEAQRKFQAADGIVDKAATAFENPSLIATAVGESVPSMLAGGVAARGVMAATRLGQMGAQGAALAGAAGEGLTMAGSQAEQIRQETKGGLLTPEQSGLAAATGLVGGAVGAVGGKVAQRLGIGDADTLLAQGAQGIAKQNADDAVRAAVNPLVQQQAVKGIPRRVIEGAIAEGFLEELPQSVAEQVFQNIALGKDWYQDVDSAVVMGVLSGSAMGGAAAGYHGMRQPGASPEAVQRSQQAREQGEQQAQAPGNAGMERVRQSYGDQLATLQQQEQIEPDVPQSTPPDGAAVLQQQRAQEQAARDAVIAAGRAQAGPDDEIHDSTGANLPPSARMGIDPAAGPLSAGAALAVDTGVHDQMLQAAAAAAQAEAEQKGAKKPAEKTQKEEQASQVGQALDAETGEILAADSVQAWTDEQLSLTFRGAQSREVRLQLAQELSRRRAAREQQALQAELDAEQAGTVPGAERADAAFASLSEDAGPVPADLSIPTTTEGATNVPEATQAQQARTEPPQVGAAPAVARPAPDAQGSGGSRDTSPSGVVDGSTTTANPGAQAEPAPGAQAQAQGGATEALRQQLHDVEAKILKAAPAAMGQGGGDIEAAMKSRKVPITLKAQRKKLADQIRATQSDEVTAIVLDVPVEQALGAVKNSPSAQSVGDNQPVALDGKAPEAIKNVAKAKAGESVARPRRDALTPAAPRKAAPRGILAKKAEAEAKARADYFTPGNVVRSYSGFDVVLVYHPATGEQRWSVDVREVTQNGAGKFEFAPGSQPRTHATEPTAQELRVGPRARMTLPEAQEQAEDSAENPPVALKSATPDATNSVAESPAPTSERITDFGEKIGGARKDKAGPAAKSSRPRSADERPAWARRFEISQIAKSSRLGEEGRWVVRDTRRLDAFKQPRQMGRETYATKEDAEQAVPLLAVSQKHRVVPVRGDGAGYEIWRDVSDRKRVKVVDQVFPTREEALEYMVGNAQAIIETNTTFGEADLPRPPSDLRLGAERRTGDARDSDFTEVFGFRGVEFGNWNNQQERQELLNDAYDGLLDLAEVMDVPPRAISLNGELALAFGARGHGLSGARAHYELDKVVINLTKMNGAGSLAHEWFHALDHYFGRQDGKAPAEWVVAKDGTRSLQVHDAPEDDMASGGTRGDRSGMRPELRDAYADVMRTISRKAEAYVEDAARADKFVATARQDVKQRLDGIRADLARDLDARYYKRHNKAATAEQLAEFDSVAEKIVAGELLELRVESKGSGRSITSGIRWTNDALNRISAVMKAVRGRQGFSAEQDGPLDRLRGLMQNYSARLKMLADAQATSEKSRMVPTEFVMNAKELDQGRGQDYWTRPHELAARAFQG